MKFGAYAGVSFLVAVTTIIHAWQTRVEYYPTVVFLTTNKLAQAVLGNWAIVMFIGLGKLMCKLFLGSLRDIEVEVMYENARYAFTETCLALTVFRGDLTAVTIALFIQLLLVKAFHWLSRARVEHLEQAGGQSLTSMARLSSLVFVTLAVDGFMVTYCLENISVDHASALVLFAFEYAILSIAAFSTAVHLVLHVVDSRMEGAWHGKATWIMLLEFFSEVFKFSFYVIFFAVMFTLYGVPPLNLIRDIYLSFDQLQRRLQAFVRYRQLASTMDERFPDATEEELAACEYTCIICRDHMDAGKKLPCSHIFHFQCLRLWLQQQQACPTCRANIPTHNTTNTAGAAAARAAAAAAAVAAPQPGVGEAAPGAAGQVAPVAPAAAGQPPAAAQGVEAARAPAEAEPAVGAGPVGAVGAGNIGGAPTLGMPRAADRIGAPLAVGAAGTFAESADFGVFGENHARGAAAPAPGFAGLVGAGGGGVGEGGGRRPADMVLQAVMVVSREGASVRKHTNRDAAVLRVEPPDSVLLLMAPPAPCGSLFVYGGWVGGPGREGEVRLVEIEQPSLTAAGAGPPHSGADGMMDAPQAGGGAEAGREGLRQRRVVLTGGDN
eukprot:g19203.t1